MSEYQSVGRVAGKIGMLTKRTAQIIALALQCQRAYHSEVSPILPQPAWGNRFGRHLDIVPG